MLGAGDIKKAKEAGFHTCQSLLMNTRKVLSPSVTYFGIPPSSNPDESVFLPLKMCQYTGVSFGALKRTGANTSWQSHA